MTASHEESDAADVTPKPVTVAKFDTAGGRETDVSGGSALLPAGALIPQPHGGALRNGGPAPGATPSIIQAALRGDFYDRLPVLRSIADGEVVEKVRVRVAALAPLLQCGQCGEVHTLRPATGRLWAEVEAVQSARPRDRVQAMELMAKYGQVAPAVKIGVADPEVVARLTRQMALVFSRETWQSGELAKALEEIWQ